MVSETRQNETVGAASGASDEPGSNRLSEAYERIVARFNDRSDSLSREGMQQELDEALTFEADVEEFTRDELAILRAWVERDVSDFRRYLVSGGESLAGFLGIDLSMLSDRLRQGLLSVADRTALDQWRFEEELEVARADYTEGEVVAPGRMACVHCEHPVILHYRQLLEPCHQCGHRYFQRAGD
ncbi:zinc ribbon-containing protein [Kushneria sp. TE3]|uniref:zinc ribbon-containing protein n=1 Tax=Kushneria sp. TE3 TaxID=3449832 RepID=UPI003F6879A4